MHCILLLCPLMTSVFEILTHSRLELLMEILGNSSHWFSGISTSIKPPIVEICVISIRYILALILKTSAVTLTGLEPLFLRVFYFLFLLKFILACSNIYYTCLILSWDICCREIESEHCKGPHLWKYGARSNWWCKLETMRPACLSPTKV